PATAPTQTCTGPVLPLRAASSPPERAPPLRLTAQYTGKLPGGGWGVQPTWKVMLSIGKIAAGPKAARYYTDQVARGREDYYAGEGEEPGRWVGLGATALGWSGEVDADDFAHLLAGAGLRRAVREGDVAGFDLTFRAP